MLNIGRKNFVARALSKARSYIYIYIYRKHKSGQLLKHQNNSSSFTHYIKYLSNWRKAGTTASALLILLSLAILFPLYNIMGVEDTEGIAGTTTPSTLTFNASSTTASVTLDLTGASNTGTYATSSNNEKASFTIATNNATGYTVKVKSTTNTPVLTNGTNNVSIISNNGITINSSSFDVNSWGILPNYYNGTTNTTNYYKVDTTGFTMKATGSANSNNGIDNADSYTLGLGLKANYNTPAGTYTNTTLVIEYTANPIAYTINYNKGRATGDITVPATQSSSTTETSVTLSIAVPAWTGYDFKGWCLGTITTTNNIDSCSGTVYNPNGAGTNLTFGIDQTLANNTATLTAMWNIKTFTLTVQNGGNTTVTGSGTYQYGETVTITATPTSNNTCTSYGTPAWVKTSGEGTLNSASGTSVTFTMGLGNATVTATSTATAVAQTVTLSKGTGVSGITIGGTNYTGTSASLTCGTYNISGSYSSGYKFSSWAVSGSVSLGSSTTTASNSITVNGTGTLTLTGKVSACTNTTFSGYMQNITADTVTNACDGNSGSMTDIRDNQIYTVKKINGQLWMTRNLAIGCNGSGSTYGSDLSNVIITNTYTNFSSNIPTSTPSFRLSVKAVSSSHGGFEQAGMQCNSTYGAWYNYAGATLSTITGNPNSTVATDDICPAGWHLPSGPNTTANTDINKLVGNTTSNYQAATTGLTAFGAVAGGNYSSGAKSSTANGYWWTTTASGDAARYSLVYNSSNGQFRGDNSSNRYRGMFVRCVKSS